MPQQRCRQSEERQMIFRGRVEHAGRTDVPSAVGHAGGGGLFYKRVNLDHDLARLTRGEEKEEEEVKGD